MAGLMLHTGGAEPAAEREYPHKVSGTLDDDATAQGGHVVVLFKAGTADLLGSVFTRPDGSWSKSGLPLFTDKVAALAYHPGDADAVAAGIVTPRLTTEQPVFAARVIVDDREFSDSIDHPEPWEYPNTGGRYTAAAGESDLALPAGSVYFMGGSTGGRFSRYLVAAWGYGWDAVAVANDEAALKLEWLQGNNYPDDTGAAGVEFLNANGVVISEHLAALTEITPNGTWEARTLTVDVPVNAATVRLLFENALIAGATANSYIANLKVTLQPREA